MHSLQDPKGDSCTVYKAPKTTVAQFTRPQRRLLQSLKAPKRGSDDSCIVSRVDKGQLELPSVDRTTVTQFEGLQRLPGTTVVQFQGCTGANWSILKAVRARGGCYLDFKGYQSEGVITFKALSERGGDHFQGSKTVHESLV